MKVPGSAILCLALWLGAWAGVRAEPAPALAIELHGDVPFVRAELEAALLPRLDDASSETRTAAYSAQVQVSAGATGVIVHVDSRQRTVPLGERTGPVAARVVALVILDLVLSEGPALPMPLDALVDGHPSENSAEATAPAPEPVAMPAAPAPDSPPPDSSVRTLSPPVLSIPAVPFSADRPAAPTPPAPALPPPARIARGATTAATVQTAHRRTAPRPGTPMLVRLSGFGGSMLGADGNTTMMSAGADVRLGLGRWRAGVGLAWLHLPTTSYEQADIGLDGASLRLEAGRAVDEVELTATGFAMPSRLRTDLGEVPRADHDELLFGGGAAVRVGARLAHRWLLVAAAGVDVFGRRLRVRTPEEVIASMPLVTISLAVGLSWEVRP